MNSDRAHLDAVSACCSPTSATMSDGNATDRRAFSPLNSAIAAITGLRDPLHEADNVVPFPARTPEVDPMVGVIDALQDARWEFEFAVIEAFNAGDVDGLTRLIAQVTRCADGLLVVETMAKDFLGRMPR